MINKLPLFTFRPFLPILRPLNIYFDQYALAQELPSVGVQGSGVWGPRFSLCSPW